MYVKYNTVLRQIGEISIASGDEFQTLSEEDLKRRLKVMQEQAKQASAIIEEVKDEDGQPINVTGNTEGNLYTTTLHVRSLVSIAHPLGCPTLSLRRC